MTSEHQYPARNMGIILLLLALACLFAMLHHPNGFVSGSGDVASSSASDTRMLRMVHGGMIAGLVFVHFAMSFFWIPLKQRSSLARLGTLTLSMGILAFIVAAIFSGFVLPALLSESINNNTDNSDSYRATIQLSLAINQVFGKLGTISLGASALVTAVLLWRSSVLSKVNSFAAAASGVCLISLALTTHGIDVKRMTLVTIFICVWLGAVGLHLILPDKNQQKSLSP